MHTTNVRCDDEDIDFGEVHDSYWTQAMTIERLGVILREEFHELHKESQAVVIYNQWRDLYPLADIPEPPKRGDFDLSLVEQSKYFFN